jgi:hypothetical protein
MPVPGDYNGNGTVDHGDYTVWRNHLGELFQLDNEGSGITPGMVTGEDYDFWKMHYGDMAGAGAGSSSNANVAVPEPTVIVMGLLPVFLVGLRKRRSRLFCVGSLRSQPSA